MLSLPLFAHSGRSSVTCEYRCGNACAHEAPNTSDNEYFGDVAKNVLSRRGVFKAGAVMAAAAGGFAALSGTTAPAAASPSRSPGRVVPCRARTSRPSRRTGPTRSPCRPATGRTS